MKEIIIICILAYLIDLVVGDPYWFPHPVIYIGKLISFIEKKIRKSGINLKFGGVILWITTVLAVFLITFFVLKIAALNSVVYFIISIGILCTTFSTKCLADEAKKVYYALESEDIDKSRTQISYIVGRDTSSLGEDEIIRAAVETVAENTVDGTIAPMFYCFIGGPVLAMTYKAVNTMDSMIGYKNEKYKDIGMFAAKADDIFNFIPARISLISFTIASFLLGYDYKSCFKIGIRDRKNHKSPNCAYSEGAVAGALGIELGGTNVYFGEVVYKPTIGDKKRKIERKDILKANKLLYVSTAVSCQIFILISVAIFIIV